MHILTYIQGRSKYDGEKNEHTTHYASELCELYNAISECYFRTKCGNVYHLDGTT